MAYHCSPLRATGPVVTSFVVFRRKGSTVWLRASQHIMVVGRVTHAGNHGAPLCQRGLHTKLVGVAVKIIVALCDDFAFEILPGAMPDAIASVYGLCSSCRLGAEIGVPRLVTRARRLRQCLTLDDPRLPGRRDQRPYRGLRS